MGMRWYEPRKPSIFSGVPPQEGSEPLLPSPSLPQLPWVAIQAWERLLNTVVTPEPQLPDLCLHIWNTEWAPSVLLPLLIVLAPQHEEWFPAETSPTQLISACLGERSWFWLIWAKPSLEQCSCCTSLAEPHKATFSSPHLLGLSVRCWSHPWASCSCMPSPVKTPSSSGAIPDWTGGKML